MSGDICTWNSCIRIWRRSQTISCRHQHHAVLSTPSSRPIGLRKKNWLKNLQKRNVVTTIIATNNCHFMFARALVNKQWACEANPLEVHACLLRCRVGKFHFTIFGYLSVWFGLPMNLREELGRTKAFGRSSMFFYLFISVIPSFHVCDKNFITLIGPRPMSTISLLPFFVWYFHCFYIPTVCFCMWCWLVVNPLRKS